MQNISKSEVNDKYVLVLKENGNVLSVLKHPIDNSEDIINDINETVENPRKTLWDLYSIIIKHLNNKNTFNYCFPYEYDSSFIDIVTQPQEVQYYSLENVIKNKRDEIEKRMCSSWQRTKDSDKYIYAKMSAYEKQFISQEHRKKIEYAKKAIRYIKCINLNKSLAQVSSDESIKMFSSENIGWTTFDYAITEDIRVMVKTNFVYGSSAYFYLAVKYKELVLIPYSDLIHYYYADMKNLISYTRSYACRRDNWLQALNFIANFVNESRKSPEHFIRKYILSETEEMIKGLRETMNHPEVILEYLKLAKPEYISMKVIRPFMKEDQFIYEMMPSESVSVFKAEKISGAIEFLDSLDNIKVLCPEVIPIMKEVVDMNFNIKSEVETTLNSIKEGLMPLEEEQEDNLKKMENIEKKIEIHENNLSKLQKRYIDKEHDIVKERYIRRNPNFVELFSKKKELQDKIYEIGTIVRRRNRLKNRMNICLQRINKLERT